MLIGSERPLALDLICGDGVEYFFENGNQTFGAMVVLSLKLPNISL